MLRICRTLKTHFGFKDVDSHSKTNMVQGVFSKVAGSYDLMNDFMSLGVHRYWKQHFVRRMSPVANMRLLDMAGGTGDIAQRVVSVSPMTSVKVMDLNMAMLNAGQKRNKSSMVQFQQGNAEDLSEIPSESQDVYSIVFGIRNCTHIDRVIKEAHRVLKVGGRIMIMEFSSVHPVLRPVYDWYSFQVIPKLGKYVANDEESYQYLVESIRMFPSQEDFQEQLSAHFVMEPYEDLNAGIATIWSGYKMSK